MNSLIKCSLCAVIFLFFDCNRSTKIYRPNKDPAYISSNFSTFWRYYHQNIKIYKDFVALDTSSNIISRQSFFKSLSTGEFIPVKITSIDTLIYKLYKLSSNTDQDIVSTIKTIGKMQINNLSMEGKMLPNFHFTDLEGKVYSEENTYGKVVTLKFWFIGCQVCIEEMPYANKIYDYYKDRNDVVFISLAFDNSNKLKNFLKTTKFNYPVVSDQVEYLENVLHIQSYPTHIILNKFGKVVRVVESAEAMEYVLRKTVVQN